jgi:hypothetical protein
VVGKNWEVAPLLEAVDQELANEMRKDMEHFSNSSAHTWQYSGSHIRERGVQMLQLSHKANLWSPLAATNTPSFIAWIREH